MPEGVYSTCRRARILPTSCCLRVDWLTHVSGSSKHLERSTEIALDLRILQQLKVSLCTSLVSSLHCMACTGCRCNCNCIPSSCRERTLKKRNAGCAYL
jgi:hypothetical protein